MSRRRMEVHYDRHHVRPRSRGGGRRHNIVVLPAFYGVPESVAYGMLPLIASFNVAQGAITVLLGIFLDEAVKKRFPIPRS